MAYADTSTDYINNTDYKTLESKLKDLKSTIEDLSVKQRASRKLRYAEVDIEAEREAGRFQPDELWIPQHIIDTNIRREQSPYVQYVTQSPRAVILEDCLDPSVDLSLLERDLTKKIRFNGWQLGEFANIDCFQANGYGVMEVVHDPSTTGDVAHEAVQYGDFGFVMDTRDIQAIEMVARAYYFTKTRLVALKGDGDPENEDNWDGDQVDKVIAADPNDGDYAEDSVEVREKSLYKIFKVMFRVDGVVQVAWCKPEVCDGWLRSPRPLYIGRRKLNPIPDGQSKIKAVIAKISGQKLPKPPTQAELAVQLIQKGQTPTSEEQYETEYPYFIFPYLISENDTISQLKGRVFLDQDVQEAVTSLLSSTCTQARRASGLYFSKDVSDPNDDLLLDKNIFFKSGSIINSKVSEMHLSPPDPGIFSAIQMLVAGNQNETSQVNFAVQNRKDSRKTAEEIKVASSQAQILSTVQVVLYSLALKRKYSCMTSVIQSRVLAGLIEVNDAVLPMYARKIIVKPSGDTDVIEKQQLIQSMTSAWSVVKDTAAGPVFLSDLLEKMFPDNAAKYIAAIQQASQQQQGQQQQQMQQLMGMVKQMADGVVKLSEKPEMFSDVGRIHALPVVEHYADMIKQFQAQQGQQNKQKAA